MCVFVGNLVVPFFFLFFSFVWSVVEFQQYAALSSFRSHRAFFLCFVCCVRVFCYCSTLVLVVLVVDGGDVKRKCGVCAARTAERLHGVVSRGR